MTTSPVSLNEKQARVMEWVKAGCPQDVFISGYQHRVIARALERRGLVDITGRGPTWHATATTQGQQWHQPTPEIAADDIPSVNPSDPPSSASGPPPKTEADLLIAKVQDADGRIVLPQDRDIEKTHERLVRLSLQSPDRPKGKKLEIVATGHWGQGPKVIVFTEHLDDHVQSRPVPVPERITRYHPAVKAFLADKEWQYVTAEHLPRAGRILQAIATEAANRGVDALRAWDAAKDVSEYAKQSMLKSHLALRTPAGIYGIQIREIAASGARKLQPRRWNERKTKPAWLDTRGWDFTSTGNLELVVRGPGTSYNGDHHRDAKTITLESKLPQLFRSFEIHKLKADQEAHQRELQKAERRRQWDTAMAQAKDKYAEQACWEHFTERSQTWSTVTQHRLFLAAAREAVVTADEEIRTGILHHLDEAERVLDGLDPLRDPAVLAPSVPEPRPEDLKPFLGRWNPHGPDRSW